ncbi:uncharacterized protein LOC104908753 [Beta vulgaris subsp. vulgaris]|uniref:uncharacterized protein LOC104908753 n=1 Tax=Beta vulgaris subsp. vulgaris TaxID=3555 RepID=UPI002036A6D2|nr:uncharacterized protein LOC104908753 [Beta vulgaris subsp. vulgaris]
MKLAKVIKLEQRRIPRLNLPPRDVENDNDVWPMTREEFERGLPKGQKSTPRVKHTARKKTSCRVESGEEELTEDKPKRKEKGKQKQIKDEGKVKGKVVRKPKAKKKLFVKSDSEADSLSESSSEYTSLDDIDWVAGEEEVDLKGIKNEELQTRGRIAKDNLLKEVNGSLQFHKGETSSKKEKQVVKDVAGEEISLQPEIEYDSDELRSIDGSSDDEERWPHFNPEVAFKHPIEFQPGMLFDSSEILRIAIQWHAIQNRYDFYSLHNDGTRISLYCKDRCDCEWDVKKTKLRKDPKLIACPHKGNWKCNFKINARKLPNSGTWQLKSMNMKHDCVRKSLTNKLTSEYLAERYIEDFRADPNWKLKAFINKVFRDTSIGIKYTKAWYARARCKLIIYGDASKQYAKVWDYVNALIEHNPGSSAYVMVDSIERPPLLFVRMYVCLNACKEGFKKGCRPVIGMDGCHLKGAYPGQCLVAVVKDGNNNIFPFAWAIVEVENKDSWCWFIELLLKDIGGAPLGEGWTFMSDREKGLLEAFPLLAPKAELRFCFRHIWANFKLRFSGSIFKSLFWNAARATTEFFFEVNMESIKCLSEEAYEYLANIPPQHWSRHKFSTNCKSNMLVNNMCETFNAVIKEARDKPVLTMMEWLRRYLMKRNYEKWQGVQSYEGKNMPYIKKTFDGMEEESRKCVL